MPTDFWLRCDFQAMHRVFPHSTFLEMFESMICQGYSKSDSLRLMREQRLIVSGANGGVIEPGTVLCLALITYHFEDGFRGWIPKAEDQH